MSVERFKNEAIEVEKIYPTLKLVSQESSTFIQGNLPVIDGDRKLWHTYDVEIHYNEGYPNAFPTVYETGGSIPRIADWHINEGGSCCLDNEFSQQIKCINGLSLPDFISAELIPWLANQSYRRLTGNYVNGEQAHGDLGRIEFFMRELKAPNLIECVDWMIKLAGTQKIPRQSTCFCGSGEKWRHCHKPIFQKLQPISMGALSWAIDRFLFYLKLGRPVLEELQRRTSVVLF